MEVDGPETKSLVLFDGVCVLCDGMMRFLYQRDRARRLWYASLQGTTAARLNGRYEFLVQGLKSIILVEQYDLPTERIYDRSEAVLRIMQKLPGLWPVLAWALIVPRPIRDFIYEWVARNRYRWFGQKESCSLPEPGMRERFLD